MLLASCVAAISRMELNDTDLLPTEAIIVSKIHSDYSPVTLRIHKFGSGWPIANMTITPVPSTLIVNKLEIGNETIVGYFSKISLPYNLYAESAGKYAFVLKPGHINYIGDFKIERGVDKGKSSLKKNYKYGFIEMSFFNNEKETIAEAKKLYPELFKKHPFYSRYTKKTKKQK